jgi:putative Ca2+/H+ antiporter (TMEM165/GDT1 family)
MVWLGSISAYMVITALSVLIGAALRGYLKPEVIKYCGASLFVIIGILMFAGKI